MRLGNHLIADNIKHSATCKRQGKRKDRRGNADCKISDADATMLVMLKEVAGACKGAGIAKGQTVLVLGAGAVAQAMCFFSSHAGAKVIVAARRAEPLERCIKCGADTAVNLVSDNLEDIVMREKALTV